MGQYFKAVNKTKKEYICPWCMGGGAKLWEWSVNPQGAVFTLLLRKSSATGGGDFGGPAQQVVELSESDDFADIIAKSITQEGAVLEQAEDSIVGRWAGDELYLVGDYDSSELYQHAQGYRNITPELIEAWNQFVGVDDNKLHHDPCESCA